MNQHQTVRVGMIGLGPRTETLLASIFALAQNGEVKVTAICDLREERIEKILGILKEHNAEKPAVYRDYLRALGFDHLTVFRGRKAEAYPL